jgi:accessory gene regulator protein AgrB
MANRPYVPKLMQLNNWVIIAAALLVLLVIARYMQHQEPPAICTDRPTAPECHR